MLRETLKVWIDDVFGRIAFFWHIFIWEEEETKA